MIIELSQAERDVIDTQDRYEWLRSTDDETLAAMAQRGLVFVYNTGFKLTHFGELARHELRVERGELPADHGVEPVDLPDLHGCEFHGGRQEHRASHEGEQHFGSTCSGRSVHCRGCGQDFCRTPSENSAIDERSPVINLDMHDLLAVMAGGNRYGSALDGTRVFLRLATPEEVRDYQHECVDRFAEEGEDRHRNRISLSQARGMVTPVDVLSRLGIR